MALINISAKLNLYEINLEFEQFYKKLLLAISNIPEEDLTPLKTKLQNRCDNCGGV